MEEELAPRDIVAKLDKYIIGQDKAKKMVAIAIRNRWRRQKVSSPLKDEIMPNNIIMIGPTGVGKTEIARRLANLTIAFEVSAVRGMRRLARPPTGMITFRFSNKSSKADVPGITLER